MVEIDFNRMVGRCGGQDAAFEELCCQLARLEPNVPVDSRFHRLRGAGGDGGVECIRQFANGDEYGWQAKYVFDFDRVLRDLGESFNTAILEHPRLVRYVMCVPFDLTGTTSRGRGQQQKFDEQRREWERRATSRGMNVRVELASASTLRAEILARDPSGGLAEYFFNDRILTDDWFRHRLEEAVRTAGPRYTAPLRVKTPLADAFSAIGQTDEFIDGVRDRATRLKQAEARLAKAVEETGDSGWSVAFPEPLRPKGREVVSLLRHTIAGFDALVASNALPYPLRNVRDCLARVLPTLRELREELRADLDRVHGPGMADSPGFRQFNAEYQSQFPAANVDAAQECTDVVAEIAAWASLDSSALFDGGEMLLLGAWGTGKTHGICDAACVRMDKGLRTLVFFGEQFCNISEPWEQIRRLLGFDADMTPERMLAALNAAGEASGKPLLVCVDGLNESRPRSFWRHHLARVAGQVARYNFVRLCVSCRSTYERLIVPEGYPFKTVLHHGFKGLEHDACRAFFEFYELEPPLNPILQDEFANPLFLRLVCEALRGTNERHLPDGWYGISTTIKAFLRSKNQAYAREHESDERARIPERAVKAFVAAAELAQRVFLTWAEAEAACRSVGEPADLLVWLLREGLLSADASPAGSDSDSEEVVRIAFERLGDHLLAARVLDQLGSSDPHQACIDGPLRFAFRDLGSMEEHRGG